MIQAPLLTPWIMSAEYGSTNLLTFAVLTSSFDFKRFVKNNVTEAGGSHFDENVSK